MQPFKTIRAAVAAVMLPSTREQALKQLETERGARDRQAQALAAQANSKPGSAAATQAARQLAAVKAILRGFETRRLLADCATLRREARQDAQDKLAACRKGQADADEALRPLRADHAKLSARRDTAKRELTEARAQRERARTERAAAAQTELDRAVREGDEAGEASAAMLLQEVQREAGTEQSFGMLGLRAESLERQVGQLEAEIGRLEGERRRLEGDAQAHEVRLAEVEHDELAASLAVAMAKAMAEHAKRSRLTGSRGIGPRALPIRFFDPAHVPYSGRAVFPGDLPESVVETLRVELFPDLDMSAFDADPTALEGYGEAPSAAA